MNLLAFDPGEMTGFATFDASGPLAWGTFPLWRGMAARFLAVPGVWAGPDVVVYERYSLYASKAAAQINSDLLTAQVVGVIRYLAEEANVPTIAQPASLIHSRRGVLSPPMRRLVLPHEARTAHERDALAHGYYYLRYTKHEATHERSSHLPTQHS